jgi:glycerol-3-phosphate acyltransferase PlsX
MSIVLDAMGSDQYPKPELEAAINASQILKEEIILVGNQDLIEPALSKLDKGMSQIRIVHAPDILNMDEHAVEATRQKPNNSMAIGIGLVKDGIARAFVTAGNTGGAYFNAVTQLRRIPGISRPALTSVIPNKIGRTVFLDTGANADCRPEFMQEFAIMGSIYAEKVLGINSPRVGLLANGEEEGKGNELIKNSFPFLKSSGVNFIGNVEPKEVFAGEADVVIADGFTGNIFIKTSEAVGKLITDVLRENISSSTLSKVGYLLAKPAFSSLKKMMDPAEVGVGILLGVNGYVFIGHGRSDARALTNGLRLAKKTADSGLLESISTLIQAKIRKSL